MTQNGIPMSQNVNILLDLDALDQLWAMVYGSGVFTLVGDEWSSRNGNLPTEALLCTAFQTDPSDSNHLLLGTEYEWLYETTDGGDTWSQMVLPDSLVGLEVLPLIYAISIDPKDEAT